MRTNRTYFKVLQSTPVTPWNAAVSRGREWRVFAFSPASSPRAVIACRENTVTLAAHEKKGHAGVEVLAHLEIIQTTMVTPWLPPPAFPL